jgi:DDE_Tnp_1-associated/Transposase DDE domain
VVGPSLIEHFAALQDPRQSWKVLYPLPEVQLVVLCGTLAGAEDFVKIRRWGQMHHEFLRRLLPFKAGVPSHDTLNDVINTIDGALFAQCFTAWVEDLREPAPASAAPEIVAIDGKTSRRTHDRSKDRGPLHLVSAWASSQRLVLGQQASETKSNEITAIPLLLERLALTGALVTIDAMGTQTRIAQAILDRGGDYLLALKDNQASLHDEVRRSAAGRCCATGSVPSRRVGSDPPPRAAPCRRRRTCPTNPDRSCPGPRCARWDRYRE